MNIEKLNLAGAYERAANATLNGLFEMEEDDYRSAPGMNQSLLKAISKSPATYKHALELEKQEKSKALELGNLIHLLILEGEEKFFKVAVRAPDLDARTKKYKEFKAEAEASGKIVVSDKDYQMIYGIYQSQQKDPIASAVFRGGQAEVAGFAKHPLGMLLKGKADYFKNDTLFDLKTTISAGEWEFAKSAKKFGYDFQAAYYLDLFNAAIGKDHFKQFAIIAVEKAPPYLFNYFLITEDDIKIARDKYTENIVRIQECERTGVWPGYEPKFKPLNFA